MNDSRTARDPVRIKKCTPRLEDIFAQGFDRELLETTRFGVEPNQIRPVESEPTKPRSVYSTGEIRPLESERNETCSGSVPESSRVQSESESEAPREATKAPPRRAPASLLHCTDLISSPSPARPPREGCTLRALAPRRVEGRAGSVGDGGRARGRRRRAPRVRAASVRRGGGGARGEAPGGPSDDARPPPVVRVVVARVFVVVARARSRARGVGASVGALVAPRLRRCPRARRRGGVRRDATRARRFDGCASSATRTPRSRRTTSAEPPSATRTRASASARSACGASWASSASTWRRANARA